MTDEHELLTAHFVKHTDNLQLQQEIWISHIGYKKKKKMIVSSLLYDNEEYKT